MDVITTANPGNRHGFTSQLSDTEKRQLVAFMMQLDDAADPSGLRAPTGRKTTSSRLSVTTTGIAGGMRIALSGIAAGAPPIVEIRGLHGSLIHAFASDEGGTAGTVTWTIPWDGRDGRGKTCPPGMVLIRARQGDKQAVTTATWIP
jgi:hypothetical protein